MKRESLVDIAVKRIKQNILNKDWLPGDKYLSEKELTGQLGVSRTVIREALSSLQSIGMIEIKPGEGNFIAHTTNTPIKTLLSHYKDVNGLKLIELVEIRKVIELGAIRLIIEKDIDIDEGNFYKLNEHYLQAIEGKDDIRQADKLFHEFLIKSADNDTFFYFSNIIQEYFSLSKLDFILGKTDLLKAHQDHCNIIQALKNKDMTSAQQQMIEHLSPIYTFAKNLKGINANGTDQ